MLSIDFVKISNSIYRPVNISERESTRFTDSAFLGMRPIALRLFIGYVKSIISQKQGFLHIFIKPTRSRWGGGCGRRGRDERGMGGGVIRGDTAIEQLNLCIKEKVDFSRNK